ncbi:hypothetical protein QBC46DRAFT_336048 [Diplogelasinospora grovesii]|uniref:C3H1-type domain-containing protein n=1 Tax=Diplogelasinospora grovesii TaxID=303347 RepID=A0AAN6NHG4_9PEZI|nr:hypothetical protein QBC46DRAFT_336048 [Diplogelasinospora grovesii]
MEALLKTSNNADPIHNTNSGEGRRQSPTSMSPASNFSYSSFEHHSTRETSPDYSLSSMPSLAIPRLDSIPAGAGDKLAGDPTGEVANILRNVAAASSEFLLIEPRSTNHHGHHNHGNRRNTKGNKTKSARSGGNNNSGHDRNCTICKPASNTTTPTSAQKSISTNHTTAGATSTNTSSGGSGAGQHQTAVNWRVVAPINPSHAAHSGTNPNSLAPGQSLLDLDPDQPPITSANTASPTSLNSPSSAATAITTLNTANNGGVQEYLRGANLSNRLSSTNPTHHYNGTKGLNMSMHGPYHSPSTSEASPEKMQSRSTGSSSPVEFYAYCFDRGNGQYTRLIPADMLPPLQDVPAIESQANNMVVLQIPPGLAPNGRSSNSEPVSWKSPPSPTRRSDPIQSHIDSIVASTPSPNTSPTSLSMVPHKRAKVYCDKWVHEGVCAFTQQGCKYKHEMPFDKATQHSLGLFHGLPAWWKKHQAEMSRQQREQEELGHQQKLLMPPQGGLQQSRHSRSASQEHLQDGRLGSGGSDDNTTFMQPQRAEFRTSRTAPFSPSSPFGGATSGLGSSGGFGAGTVGSNRATFYSAMNWHARRENYAVGSVAPRYFSQYGPIGPPRTHAPSTPGRLAIADANPYSMLNQLGSEEGSQSNEVTDEHDEDPELI